MPALMKTWSMPENLAAPAAKAERWEGQSRMSQGTYRKREDVISSSMGGGVGDLSSAIMLFLY